MSKVDLVILGLLMEKARHGYDILQQMERRDMKNWVGVSTPAIYKGLARLESKRVLRARTESGTSHPDRTVYEIRALPKTRLQPVFQGTVYVQDGTFALQGVDLKTADHIVYPMPIREAENTYRQQFSNFGRDFWLPVSCVREVRGKIQIPGLTLTIQGRELYEIKTYAVNVALPDSLFEDSEPVRIDTSAARNDAFSSGESRIVVPLTDEEKRTYETADSSLSVIRLMQPEGFLSKLVIDAAEDEEQEDGRSGERRWSIKPEMWFSRTDGLHLALHTTIRCGEDADVGLGVGYHTASRKPAVAASFRWKSLSLEYHSGSWPRYASHAYPRLLTSLFSVCGQPDYFDYYWSEGVGLAWKRTFDGLKTDLSVGFRAEEHSSLPTATDYALFRKERVRRENPPVDEGSLRSIFLAVASGSNPIPLGFAGQRRLEFTLEYSDRSLFRSDFSFLRLGLVLDWRMATLFRRRFSPNCLDLRIVASTSAGRLPVQRFVIVDASLGGFSAFGAFKSLRSRPYEGEKTLAVFWEHNFRTVPFEILGLRGLARRGVEVILHGASGRTWLDETRMQALGFVPNSIDHFHHEIGFSINKLFYVLRLDFTARLDRRGFFFGVSVPRFI